MRKNELVVSGCLMSAVTSLAAQRGPLEPWPPYRVSVTPDGGVEPQRPANTGGYSTTFWVQNTGLNSDTYTIDCWGSVNVTCTGTSLSSVPLGSAAQTPVTAYYDVGAGGTGSLTLSATSTRQPDLVYDEGYYTVPVTGLPQGAAVVALRNYNGANRDRSLCLTSSAGEAAAWQCGDMLVSHSLPGYATLGRERSLTLLYNSAQAVPKPVVAVSVNEGAVAPPASVFVRLSINGVAKDSATYSGWGSAPITRQIVLSHDASGDATGVYPFTLLVRNLYSGASYDATVAGNLIVVNGAQGDFGSGWSLAGVERLYFNQPIGAPNNAILWVGGDGSAKIYDSVAVATWRGAAGAYRDTLVRFDSAATTWFRRTLRHGVKVSYDAGGRHVRTTNRAGQATQFFWNATTGRLDSIAVPPAVTLRPVYKLTYDGNGKLDKITDPANRVLDATVTAGRLITLLDPDNHGVGFGYDGVGRLTARTTRRGFTTKYVYGRGLRVTIDSVPLDTLQTRFAVDTFRPWDEKGLNGQAAVDTSLAYTQMDGPRTDVADTAAFWVDRWGAPVKFIDPVGGVTTIVRGDTARPALVTRVTRPDNAIVTLTWDSRGNLTQTRDSTSHLPDGLPTRVRRWTYFDTQTSDAPDAVIDSTDNGALVTRFAYNSWGFTDSIIAPNGHRAHFDYLRGLPDSGVVQAVVERQVPLWDPGTGSEIVQDARHAFGLDALGNVVSDTSPAGHVTRYHRDAAERIDSVIDPVGHQIALAFDPLNRRLQSTQYESGVSLTTRQHYAVDVIDTVVDSRQVPRRYVYDAVNRPIAEIDDYGKTERRFFGPTGLLDSLQSRYWQDSAGHMARYYYDAVGRELRVVWPARKAVSTDAVVPADSMVLTYDVMGRVRTGISTGLTVSRSYYATGDLKTDNQVASTHAYGYDRVGRRVWYRMGIAGDLAHSDSVWYRYDASSGDLKVIGVRWRGTGSFRDSVSLAWDALERRDTVTFRNGTVVKFAYDGDGLLRLVCSTHPYQGASPDVLNTTLYHDTVGADGLVLHSRTTNTGLTGCGSSASQTYGNTYNARHMLTRQTRETGDIYRYVYDSSGNMTESLDSLAGSLLHDDRFAIDPSHNRLTRVDHAETPGTGTTYSYDANGSRFDEVPFYPGSPPDTVLHRRHYYYDGLGRTTGHQELYCTLDVATNECLTGSNNDYWVNDPTVCAFDALGRLYRSCSTWGGIGYLGYDGANVVRTGADNATGTWTFVHGPGVDDPLIGYAPGLGGKIYAYFITDGQGRQLAVADTLGWDMTAQNSYASNGGSFTGGVRNANTFGADRNRNQEFYRLSFFRNRFYDQQTGRWTQEDPIGVAGGVNLYAYVGNNPATFTDPFGLSPCSDLRAKIDELTADIQGRVVRYEEHLKKGDADSGHWKQIKQRQRELERKRRTYEQMKCDHEDDHKNWPGGSAAADAVSITVPPYQVDQSSGYRPHQMTLPSLPAPTPAQVNTVGATAILVIIGRVLLVGAVVVP